MFFKDSAQGRLEQEGFRTLPFVYLQCAIDAGTATARLERFFTSYQLRIAEAYHPHRCGVAAERVR
jgi:hypothetical protein